MQDSKAKNSWTNKSFASEISAWTCINAILYIPSALPLSAFYLHGSRGCLGCYTKPTPMGEPSQRLRIHDKYVRRNSVSEDFWSSSTFEMDNSTVQSQRSISSIGTSNQAPLDQQGFDGSVSNPSEFVNHGLLLWNQTRQQWLGNKRSQSHPQVREPKIRWNETYDSLLSTKKPFRQPIPLREMVEFLVDIWDQEGLYD